MNAMPHKIDDTRELHEDSLGESVLRHLIYSVGKDKAHADARDWNVALSLAVRDRMVEGWIDTTRRIYKNKQKRVYYLSMEFMIGRMLEDNLTNLGLLSEAKTFLKSQNLDVTTVINAEQDAALGNGGLGRLAACFMDSMATTGVAGMGYGIRYQHGIFRQAVEDGWQVEEPEDWLFAGNSWEFRRPEVVYEIGFGGHVTHDEDGKATWHPSESVQAVAFDMPIAGWEGDHVNTLRLWSARQSGMMNLDTFNDGDFMAAARQQVLAETISKVLYPGDHTPQGRELRLKQEVFFTSASLHDLLRRFFANYDNLDTLGDHVAVQLNDTHPAIAVPELIRILMDDHGYDFDHALKITRETLHYTNHTLLPEALEKWPRDLFEQILPRHLQIINMIDGAFYREAIEKGLDHHIIAGIQAIHPHQQDWVRMGNLAFIGSRKVNGVSALHTELMKQTVFHDLHTMYPDKIINQTNGVTPRRWLLECNPGLSDLVTEQIGDGWIDDLEQLKEIEPLATDADFQQRYMAVKAANKQRLADMVKTRTGVILNSDAIFDVQIKRIHEYKRQHMNILETIALYNAIKANPDGDWQPRVKIFAGKAAPSYFFAKLIIKLINDVAKVVNNDPDIGDKLKVVFLPNYNVSMAEILIPGADLSEQISTAGFEASGTGNMKFALNGALTIGTLDGANVEMLEHVDAENIFIFGMNADEVAERQHRRARPSEIIKTSPALQQVMTQIGDGTFSDGDTDRYRDFLSNVTEHDYFQVVPDFQSYWDMQRHLDALYGQSEKWAEKTILNTARMGWFSSDRTIRSYADQIWRAPHKTSGP
ncbi:alpha-1,4 glucan phosphorylase [Algimonas ampicilliniresistens]|uniref:Alpha-1,4 glucan phosphorylase n=1 Tax=Algimonas ampicilliniresistens TaxID=1298735 RepID=A0ABQ5VB91_9PROT|nr:glycogen/starch/alpha-glucan phosphorylase [Algimonas ampicilliniresistens]GLQ24310.1 alpha-1,4 glucan phosphorylase [Algimonas ampicilliniresistens]